MNVAKGIANAMGSSGILGIAQGAIIAAAGTVQIAKIVATTIGMNEGGKVPGTGNKDTVPAMLTPQEFVLPQNISKYYGDDILERLRTGKIPKEILEVTSSKIPNAKISTSNFMAQGGFPSPKNWEQERETKTNSNINIVNITDPAVVQQSLNKKSGKETVLNLMANHKSEFKKVLFS